MPDMMLNKAGMSNILLMLLVFFYIGALKSLFLK
jgi:hypothetical protein